MNLMFKKIVVLIFIFSSAWATRFDIATTKNANNKTIFFLKSAPLATKNSAQQLLQKIKNSAKDAKLEFIADKYIISIGPRDDYPSTQQLKLRLNNSTAANKIWNLRNADIRAVITEVSKTLNKNFIIDPRVKGKISIVSSKAVNNKELYQIFLSILQVAGFSAINQGQIIKIVPDISAKTYANDIVGISRNDELVVEVVTVKYVPADQLIPVLRPLMPQWSHVAAYAPSNSLIFAGRARNIAKLTKIVKQVDRSSANGIDMVPLKNSLAMDIVNTLKNIINSRVSNPRQAKVTIAADDRSNSVLVTGSKTERIRLRLLIAKLDRQSIGVLNSNTKVLYLHYLRAQDIAPILASIAKANFSGKVGTTIGAISTVQLDNTPPASSIANNSATLEKTTKPSLDNTQQVAAQDEENKPTVQIIAEPNTNAIIVNAPISVIRILQSVIAQLDIRPAQLLIEALVVEIDQNAIQDLGIEWGSRLKNGVFRPGLAIINSQSRTEDLQAQIYALATQRKANILSTPSVIVLDNRQAKILVGQQVSVATTSFPNNANGTTTATPFTTFERVNVALHLYVRPQITTGRGIKLQIDQGNDSLDPSSIASSQPIFKVSSIVTSVHVQSGEAVVLGGLIQNSISNTNNKLPILGDIPGIGRLFQRNKSNREKRVLMVFVKPVILKDASKTSLVSNNKYNQTRLSQLRFNREQDFDPRNREVILPSIKNIKLPTPFK